MTITVQADRRTAALGSPACFSIEAIPVTILGVELDTATLRLVLYTIEGIELARCETWTGDSTAGYLGTVDSRTDQANTLFAGKRPDAREPAVLAIGDKNLLRVLMGVEITNNPLRAAPAAPDPAKHYLTADLFSDLGVSDDPTPNEIAYTLRQFFERMGS